MLYYSITYIDICTYNGCLYIYIEREIYTYSYIYIYIGLCIGINKQNNIYIYIYICVRWRDAVRRARWGLEICGLLSSLLKYCSQGKTLRPALAEKSKHHRDMYVRLLGGLAPSACLTLLFPILYYTIYTRICYNILYYTIIV